MKIKELIYQTPEMSEEKLFEFMDKHIQMVPNSLKRRILDIHYNKNTEALPITHYILEEFDLIQDKKSYLTKSQREQIVGFVGLCMIQMTKDNEHREQ